MRGPSFATVSVRPWDMLDLLIALRRAEGYRLALECSHVIDHAEWRRLSVLLAETGTTRNEQLSRDAPIDC